MSEALGGEELKIMRKAGKTATSILRRLKKNLRAGISTKDIEELFDSYLSRYPGMEAAFKGFNGYPASICVSVNDEIIHGIPSSRIIKQGDIVSVDVGIKYKGLYVDTAYTYTVGRVSKVAKKLIKVTMKALRAGIRRAKPGAKVGDIGAAIQNTVERHGFSVIRKFVGHGIGRKLHLVPEIPNFGRKGQGYQLKEGMVIAIEPMVAVGDYQVRISDDGWTAKTQDKSLSAHFEHTVAITRWGPKILTH
ncbi:MAG: type I methionyl aminopeptidase [Candidatus Omnitrophota bacterium]|nr:MAG: type I methionyl aminopeptidase [Candidatus Omnitrophota bacterium]